MDRGEQRSKRKDKKKRRKSFPYRTGGKNRSIGRFNNSNK